MPVKLKMAILSGLLIGHVNAAEQVWNENGTINVIQWEILGSQGKTWQSPKLSSAASHTDLKPLKIADGTPFRLQILKNFKSNAQSWFASDASLHINNALGEWKDSSVIRYTSFLSSPKIVIDDQSYIPLDSNLYKSVLRIISSPSDTTNNGLVSGLDGKYQIKGIVSGEHPSLPNSVSIWYGSAVLYHADTVKYLPQITNGDSAKARLTIQNTINNESFDSAKVQLIGYKYVTSSQTPIIPTPKSPKIIRGPFEIEGRSIRINQQSDTKQLLNVFNTAGEVLQFWKFTNTSGIKEIQLDQAHFPAGVYFLKLYNSSGSFQTQAILQD